MNCVFSPPEPHPRRAQLTAGCCPPWTSHSKPSPTTTTPRRASPSSSEANPPPLVANPLLEPPRRRAPSAAAPYSTSTSTIQPPIFHFDPISRFALAHFTSLASFASSNTHGNHPTAVLRAPPAAARRRPTSSSPHFATQEHPENRLGLYSVFPNLPFAAGEPRRRNRPVKPRALL